MSTIPRPPQEAIDHFNRATSIEAGPDDKSGLIEVAGELALAIKKANNLFPEAHAKLGMVYAMLDQEEKARQEFNIAVQQDRDHTFARGMLLMMDMDNLGIRGTRPQTGSFMADMLILGGKAASAKSRLNKFSKQIDELIQTFIRDIGRDEDVDYWVYISGFMLNIHDDVQGINGLPQKDRIARAILGLQWDKVKIPSDYRQAVDDIKRRAEGRMLLAR
jgi:tetratricopeptide (TPR) repeat protein